MFFWLAGIGAGVIVLLIVLIRLLRSYDRTSGETALEQIKSLEIQVQALESRLINLEAIESDHLLDAMDTNDIVESESSASSGSREAVS